MNNQLIKLIFKSLNMKILALLFLTLLVSCSENEIKIEAEQFCSCRRTNAASPEKCNDILKKLSIKYQFDSQAAEELKEAIDECLPLN